MPDKEAKNSLTDTEVMALILLKGCPWEDDRGAFNTAYLAEDSDGIGHRSLRQILRSEQPLSREIRDALADLFDNDLGALSLVERKLVFKFRKPGNRANVRTGFAIAEFICDLVEKGIKREAAFQEAMDKFELKKSSVLKAWSTWKRVFEMQGRIATKPKR